METVLIVLLMLFNVWTVFYMMNEKKMTGESGDKKPPEPDNGRTLPDIMGKSKFRMPERRRTEKDIPVPEAATSAKAEAVDEKDVTFADEMKSANNRQPKTVGMSRQVPDDKLDETFTDYRVSDLSEYDEDEGFDGTPHQAGGHTFEDIDRAVLTVKKPKAADGELDHAGKVFIDMEGNELFDKLTNSEGMYAKVREVMNRCLDRKAKAGTDQDRNRPASVDDVSNYMPGVPDDIADFDFRDYV